MLGVPRHSSQVLSSTRTRGRSTRSRPLPSCDEVVHRFGTRRWCRTRSHAPGTSTSTRVVVGLRTTGVARSSWGLSQMHDAPGLSWPTQHPQVTRVGRVPQLLEPLTYSHQRAQPHRARAGATRGVHPKKARE